MKEMWPTGERERKAGGDAQDEREQVMREDGGRSPKRSTTREVARRERERERERDVPQERERATEEREPLTRERRESRERVERECDVARACPYIRDTHVNKRASPDASTRRLERDGRGAGG